MRNLIWIVLIALIAGVGWSLWQQLESYEEQVPSGYGEAARRDPLLALQRFLQAGGEVQRSERTPDATELETATTLVVSDSRHLYGGQLERVLAWVVRGGHLIVAAGAEEDALLQRLHVQVQIAGAGDEQDGEERLSERLREANRRLQAEAAQRAGAPPDGTVELMFEAEADPARVRFNPQRALIYAAPDDEASEAAPFYQAGGDAGVQLMQFQRGEGMITLLSDMTPWHNGTIGDLDHALLAHWLVNADGVVILLSGTHSPGLPTLIWHGAPELVTALGLCLLAWLAHRGRRFGPPRRAGPPLRRTLAEHLLASARYHWQQRQIADLLREQGEALQTRASQRWGNAHAEARLASAAGLTPEALRTLLADDPKRDPERLLTLVTHLQTLDRTLR